MKIRKLHFAHLHNAEHYEFHLEVNHLIQRSTPEALKIVPQSEEYAAALEQEKGVVTWMRKNNISDQLAEADKARDKYLSVLKLLIKTKRYDDDQQVARSADNLSKYVRSIGDIAKKPYNAEIGALHSLYRNLTTQFAEEVEALGIRTAVEQLQQSNISFEELMRSRYNSMAGRTSLRMKEARIQVDEVYLDAMEHINAWLKLTQEEVFVVFANQLNERINYYRLTMNKREGRIHGEAN